MNQQPISWRRIDALDTNFNIAAEMNHGKPKTLHKRIHFLRREGSGKKHQFLSEEKMPAGLADAVGWFCETEPERLLDDEMFITIVEENDSRRIEARSPKCRPFHRQSKGPKPMTRGKRCCHLYQLTATDVVSYDCRWCLFSTFNVQTANAPTIP
ncbi:hypothetical protein ASPWEDRAFT_30384 [Aspergillus wentii DTO 134E9]|uniref:Uncharacterized protein n=1 Tax=Aspergillus wentii DTO 134E9 TaxID=1073089 RepID=A0A1L9REE3_ASPWE|nr:uncharacterized protein ASPWEDRAFT_30384 [Aspergillus wentii DTO 134E9]KAI9933543.1 hypothetical protein MW887_008016 [Aspergillus wentii]OJJ33291.1 hypothetical protein ASPWEDRAFT_30384 [Aspergillus wentii DTO 134E9]